MAQGDEVGMHPPRRASLLRDLFASIFNQPDSFPANGSSLLGRSGTR
jgi:hypothetical protein